MSDVFMNPTITGRPTHVKHDHYNEDSDNCSNEGAKHESIMMVKIGVINYKVKEIYGVIDLLEDKLSEFLYSIEPSALDGGTAGVQPLQSRVGSSLDELETDLIKIGNRLCSLMERVQN